ncbi:MAG: formimidoylglutamate deiminase [Proteobacteria bacterium]|nr:formimidoylglutamate deiminase [Pseudomonadota bacterium]
MSSVKSYFFKEVLLPDGWYKNVRVTIEQGKFATIKINDKTRRNKAQFSDIILDCVIPAMPNCHSHVFQRAMAGLTEYKTSKHDSFWSWRDLMYQYANQINAEQLYHLAKYVYTQMLQAGYANVCEFHYIHRGLTDKDDVEKMSLAIITAAHEVGIGLTFLPVLYTQAHIDATPLSTLQQRFKLSTTEYISLYKSLAKQLYPEQNMGICFHSLRAVAITQMQQVLSALNNNQPIHLHIAEQIAEVEQIMAYSSKRPVELLLENFAVNENWCLIHATHLSHQEIQLLAQSNATVGLCPTTEANLGDGTFPLTNFLQHAGNFAIGSDSHVVINPFNELQILEYSQRLKQQKRIIASSNTTANVGTFLWNNAVRGGAGACHLPVAGIQIGQRANWLSVDTNEVLFTNLTGMQILDTMVLVSNHICVETYINGKKQSIIAKNIVENYKNTLKSLR